MFVTDMRFKNNVATRAGMFNGHCCRDETELDLYNANRIVRHFMHTYIYTSLSETP